MSPRIPILATLCAALTILMFTEGGHAPPPATIALRIPALAPGQADGFIVRQAGGQPVELARMDDGWVVGRSQPLAADADAIERVESAMATPIPMDRAIRVDPAARGPYGLGDGALEVELRRGEETLLAFRVGKVVNGRRTFIAPRGDPRIYRARANLRLVFDHAAPDWRERAVFHRDPNTLRRLEVRRGGRAGWTAVRAASDQPWTFERPNEWTADSNAVENVARSLSSLEASRYLDGRLGGAPQTPAPTAGVEVRARTFNGADVGVMLGAPNTGGASPGRRLSGGPVFEVPHFRRVFLDPPAAALRDRRLLPLDVGEIVAVKIGDRRVAVPAGAPALGETPIGRWLTALTTLHVAGFPPAPDADPFAPPPTTVIVERRTGPPVALTIGRTFNPDGARYARMSLRPTELSQVSATTVRALSPPP